MSLWFYIFCIQLCVSECSLFLISFSCIYRLCTSPQVQACKLVQKTRQLYQPMKGWTVLFPPPPARGSYKYPGKEILKTGETIKNLVRHPQIWAHCPCQETLDKLTLWRRQGLSYWIGENFWMTRRTKSLNFRWNLSIDTQVSCSVLCACLCYTGWKVKRYMAKNLLQLGFWNKILFWQ